MTTRSMTTFRARKTWFSDSPTRDAQSHLGQLRDTHAGILNDTFVAVHAHNGTDAHHHKHRTGYIVADNVTSE